MQGSSSEDAAGYLVRTLMDAYSTLPTHSPTYNFAWRSAPACVGPLHRSSAPPEPPAHPRPTTQDPEALCLWLR